MPHRTSAPRPAPPQRNGSRPRILTTTAGDLELRIPKLRAGSSFPSLLERRRRVDQCLFAVVMAALSQLAESGEVAPVIDRTCSRGQLGGDDEYSCPGFG